MKNTGISIRFTLVIALLLLCIPSGLFAYIDPGSGSYIIQVIIAAFLGGAVAIKVFWQRIKNFFASRFSKKPQELDNE
jgi:hypothetical protein